MSESKIVHVLFAMFALGAAAPCKTFAAEPIQFIPATPDNTTLIDGSPVNTKDGVWKWLPNEGNQGILESNGDPKKNAPALIIHARNLEPGRDYEVFGFLWTHGFGEPPASRGKQPYHWPARFGLSLASLTTFGGKHSPKIPWIVSPDTKLGVAREFQAILEEKDPQIVGGADWISTMEDLRLIRVRLGVSRADKAGTLPVFADDFPDSIHCGRTRIDGIGVRIAPAGAAVLAGAGNSTALHLALRAGDKTSVIRELEAGADANALDSTGLSPLFHPAATGHQDLVKLLLAKGADPNLKGQTVLSLTAAASVGDAAMVRILLDAGAEVPAGKLERAPWMPASLDQSHLHPAIAATRIGSLASLKALLEKRPDLALEALGSWDQAKGNTFQKDTSAYLVEDAMAMGHDELAAFLIGRGCALRTRVFSSSSPRPGIGLLVRSITEGKTLARSREALLARGLPAVSRGPSHDNEIVPWDGLSAAVAAGDAELVRRFLPMASSASDQDRKALLTLAHWSGVEEIIQELGRAFPETKLEWDVQTADAEKPQDEASLRLLLPRTKPPESARAGKTTEWTLAVLPAPDEGGQSALLEVAAAKANGWNVVDRQEIETALGEARFANPWGKGEHRLADLGDRLAADLLILVSRLRGKDIELLRFEAVDVATGLPVLREHMESKAFASEAAAAVLLERIRAAFAKARAGQRPRAITMLPFSVDPKVPNALSLSRLFDAAIHAEVDSTPGILSVNKEQMQAIANEQKLAGAEGLWAAAYTLEGGVAAGEDGMVSLTLRLRPLDGDDEKGIDVTEDGPFREIAALAAGAWRKLITSEAMDGGTAPSARPDPRQAAAEAARLLREGEWLANSGSPHEALPLFERAELLGANPEQLVFAHLATLAKCIRIGDRKINLASPVMAIKTHPPSLSRQVGAYRELGRSRALLDQAAYYLSRYGAASLKWKDPKFRDPARAPERGEFLHVVTILSHLNATLPKSPPAGFSGEALRAFDDDLERFTADYFRIRSGMEEPSMSPAYGELFRYGPGTAAMLRRNPELLKGWVTMFFAATAKGKAGSPNRIAMLRSILSGGFDVTYPWYGHRQLIIEEIVRRMEGYNGSDRALREAEMALIRATDDERAHAAKRYASEVAKVGRRDRYRQAEWLSGDVLQRYGPADLLDRSLPIVPRHEDALVAALVHEPISGMDWICQPHYDRAIRALVRLEEDTDHGISMYFKTYNPWEDYDTLAQQIAKNPDGWPSLLQLLGGARLWERIHGRNLHDELSKRWNGLYAPKDKKDDMGPLAARLLVDLRTADNSRPGMFRLPTIDNSKEGTRLWVYFQPFEEQPIPLGTGTRASIPIYPWRQPWLLGIDCVAGRISTAANLGHAPGFDSVATNTRTSGFKGDEGFIVQTNDMILTSAQWVGMNETSAVRRLVVFIRKDDGKIVPLDQPIPMASTPDMVQSRAESVGAVAIGEEFFCLQKAGDPDAFYSVNDKIPFQIVRIAPTGKVTPLTVFGRRPQLTPFDPMDRYPRMLLRDGNRLLVIRDLDYNGYYDPKNDSWDMNEQDNLKRMTTARNLTNNEFRSHIHPHSRIKVGDGSPDLFVHNDSTFPNMLSVVKPGGGETRIKVRLELPDGFSTQMVFGDPVYSNGKSGTLVGYATYGSREGTDAYSIVVLNQTKDDLILGLQVGKGLKWLPGKRVGAFLPLLWAIPKSELIAAFHDNANR